MRTLPHPRQKKRWTIYQFTCETAITRFYAVDETYLALFCPKSANFKTLRLSDRLENGVPSHQIPIDVAYIANIVVSKLTVPKIYARHHILTILININKTVSTKLT